MRLLSAGRPGLTLLAWLALASPIHADVRQVTKSVENREEAGEAIRGDPLLREIESFKASPVHLRRALAIAEGLHAGARVVDISFDGGTDHPVYRVKASRGDRVWQDTINAHTGDVDAAGASSSLAGLDRVDRQLLVRLRAVRQEMIEAVAVAERNASGEAVSAGLAMDHGRLVFVVVCVSGSNLKQVLLEPPVGNAIPKR